MVKERRKDLTKKTMASYCGREKAETTEMLLKKGLEILGTVVWIRNIRGQDMGYCQSNWDAVIYLRNSSGIKLDSHMGLPRPPR